MFEKLKSILSKAPSQQIDGASLMWNLSGSRGVPKRASAEMVNAYKNTPWLRSVCSRVATDVASTCWKLYTVKGKDGKAKRVKSMQRMPMQERQKALAVMKRAGDVQELDDHPLLDLLHHGNRMLPGHSAMEVSQLHLDIQGEAFWYLDKFGKMPIAFWPIPPNWISKVPTPDEPYFTLQYGSTRQIIPADLILWFRNPDPANPFSRGTGVAESMGDELDTDEYAARYIKSFFYNNGTPDALIGLKGASKAQLEEAQARWDQRYRGAQNGHRTAFHNGEINVEVLSSTFKDQQMVELRGFVRDTIIQIFGVPPECVGVIENSNRATIEAASYIMARYVTTPRLERIRDVLQDRLVPMFDERLILGYESPIPDDKDFRLKAMMAQPGTVTRAEYREFAGLESHGAVDDVYLMGAANERSIHDPELYSFSGAPEEAPIAPPKEDPEAPEQEDEIEEEDEDGLERSAQLARTKGGRTKASENDIEATLLALEPEPLVIETNGVVRDLVESFGADVLQDLGIAAGFNSINPRVTEHLQALALEHLKNVDHTTKEALRSQLLEGVRAGESVRELSARINDVFEDARGYRATRIARTEVLRSSNFATWEAQVQAGIVKLRQWVSTPDTSTRESHLELNGQVRAIDESFDILGGSAMHPGDFGIAEEDINCRCTTIPLVDGQEPKAGEALSTVWKAYDKKLLPWEKRTRAALRKGFAQQRDDVIDALYNVTS